MGPQTILEVKELYKNFGDTKVINGVSILVTQGSRHAVIGPNGAGKTTLFNLLSGRYKPSEGEILFKGTDISGLPPHRLSRLNISRSFQIINFFPKLTVFENIHAVIMSKHRIRYNFIRNLNKWGNIKTATLQVLDQINLLDKKDVMANYLSYGEQRALEVGLAIASDPELILLDEPTAGMSIDETRQMIKLIDAVTAGKTLIIIEHDMEVVFSLADVVTVMNYGTIVASGKPEEIRGDRRIKEIYLGEK